MIDWENIKQHLTNHKPICIFDFPDREAETDVVFIGIDIDPSHVHFLRSVVGGPLALYLSGTFLKKLGIVPFVEFIRTQKTNIVLQTLTTHNRGHDPRFALSIDARDNWTGCSPIESAHTINVVYEILLKEKRLSHKQLESAFSKQLVFPGHIPVIACSEGLLDERNGHSELAMSLARCFGLPEIVVAGELISPKTLKSMNIKEARAFAKHHGFPFLTGEDIMQYWSANKKTD